MTCNSTRAQDDTANLLYNTCTFAFRRLRFFSLFFYLSLFSIRYPYLSYVMGEHGLMRRGHITSVMRTKLFMLVLWIFCGRVRGALQGHPGQQIRLRPGQATVPDEMALLVTSTLCTINELREEGPAGCRNSRGPWVRWPPPPPPQAKSILKTGHEARRSRWDDGTGWLAAFWMCSRACCLLLQTGGRNGRQVGF